MSESEKIVQKITIIADSRRVFQELLTWGESNWWPQGSLMRFINLTGEINEDTVYLQKVSLPCGPCWHTRNELIDHKKLRIKRVFLDGMFQGYEELHIKPGEAGIISIVYTFHYQIKGIVNRIVWDVLFKKLHKDNITSIFRALKKYMEGI